MSRFDRFDEPQRPQATRIVAITGAITVNLALLLLLISPMAPSIRLPQDDMTIVPIFVPKTPVQPPPPPKPEEVKIRTPSPRPAPRPVLIEVPADPPIVVTDPQPGDIAMDPVIEEPAVSGEPSLGPDEPQEGAYLAYRHAPPPPYPPQAIRAGQTGTVILRVTVDVGGTPLEVAIERSSGNRLLDNAARRHVLAKWRFEPALRNGVAVRAIGRVPIEFTLDR